MVKFGRIAIHSCITICAGARYLEVLMYYIMCNNILHIW
ncbi:hypothetical protein DCCM_1064 [Desulfocucumis palustris]|uniref:Uncharacterized protein n=1 Tax=Desulfocucumis palustris TaxID=1898651 RepID=A0A2L2X9Q1_9FIRM|nr:hypothetical protein DCCM_1064 [Desulfocucumis palustris]